MRYRLVEKLLNELKLPYDNGCVNFITNSWEEEHEEQLEEIKIEKEDILNYWMDFVEYLMYRK